MSDLPQSQQSLRFEKAPIDAARLPGQDPEFSGPVRVIIKVSEPGYVPKGFTVRTRVDDIMFTADALEADLAAAADDPHVESVEPSRLLQNP